MVQIIESNRKPSFSEQISRGIDAVVPGIQGFLQQREMQQTQQAQAKALQQAGIDPSVLNLPPEAKAEYFKNAFARDKQLDPLQQAKLEALQGNQELFKKFGNQFEPKQNQQNGMQNPQEQQQSQPNIKNVPDEMLDQIAAFAGQPGEPGVIGNMAQAEKQRRNDERKDRTKKETQYFKLNEPSLKQLADTQRKLETEELRYDKLENLFSDPSKFPSSFTAALFSKEGQINDLAYSQLTPEAQEAIKLIIDSTSNIKDTYGARITNFDLQTYLKKLPSLLNSPEGKSRVLRDLKIMNQLNQMHAQGIQDIFEDAGGSDKIPYSKAESIYRKRFGEQEKALKEKFVNPDKGIFKDLPNANQYLGRKIKNPDTGEVFISDGNEWKPFKG